MGLQRSSLTLSFDASQRRGDGEESLYHLEADHHCTSPLIGLIGDVGNADHVAGAGGNGGLPQLPTRHPISQVETGS